MFKCAECGKTVRKVSDVRDCQRCGSRASASIPSHHTDSDFLTPALIGYLVGLSFSHDSGVSQESFTGGGGDYSGAGASGSYDAPDSSSSNDSGSSSDSSSSSSDSGSSSGDSGSSSSDS